MMERAPQAKHEEQYPLLKVDGGGGDGTINQTPPTVVTRSSMRSWLDKWPEFISALWMTGILLGISFLVMYALSMGAIRRHPVIILKCNDSMKPASQVHYHYIVQIDTFVPFLEYSKYLADMAVQYPNLHFNVYFLLDDSLQSAVCRRSKFFSKLITYNPSADYITGNFDKANLIGLRDFQKRYQNVNITVLPLSKYMATTPLKHKWRNIPVPYLPFYARIYSVWQNSGIAIDLATFNYKFTRHQGINRRIAFILQQHNDGINPEEYRNGLNNIKKEEEYEFFAMFCGMIGQILNETRAFFNKTLPSIPFYTDKESEANEPLIRTHRNKRHVSNKSNVINDTRYNVDRTVSNNSHVNNTISANIDSKGTNKTKITNTTKTVNKSKKYIKNAAERVNFTNISVDFQQRLNNSDKKTDNVSEALQVVLIYDISLLSDSIGPSYVGPEQIKHNPVPSPPSRDLGQSDYIRHNETPSHIFSIDPEGTFVAVSSRFHPFLKHLMSNTYKRTHPKYVIQDTLLTQCTRFTKNELYCNNIFLL